MAPTSKTNEMTTTEVARIVRDLLNIAKVAMPEDLYSVDPRIINAEALLARLEGKVN